MKKCNTLSMDAAGVLDDIVKEAVGAMHAYGEMMAEVMRQEVGLTTYGGAPGIWEWRDDIRQDIGLVSTTITQDGIEVQIGYYPLGKAEEVRALLVADGSGDKAEGGGKKIHAGPPGRSVWDEDLAAKRPSRARSKYGLPDGFNQRGNQFVRNAVRRARLRYGESVGQALRGLPDYFYHRRVKEKRQ